MNFMLLRQRRTTGARAPCHLLASRERRPGGGGVSRDRFGRPRWCHLQALALARQKEAMHVGKRQWITMENVITSIDNNIGK